MHILLTDVLVCPRCGPGFGLILLADRIEARRVLQGRLGCANCREAYPVQEGAADLRVFRPAAPGAAGSGLPDAPASPDPDARSEAATRLAALLGLAGAQGRVVVAGPAAALSEGVAALVPELEVVGLTPEPVHGTEAPGVSRVAAAGLPFASKSLRGLALAGGLDAVSATEAVRVVAPAARVVVDPAAPGDAAALAAAGAAVLLAQEGVVVAAAPGPAHPHGG